MMTAIIAATVAITVAVISHAFTRNREHANWLREKLFDMTHVAMKAHRDFSQAVEDNNKILSVKGTVPWEVAFEVVSEHDWIEVHKASQKYQKSIHNMWMLSTDRRSRHLIKQLLSNHEQAIESIYMPPDAFMEKNPQVTPHQFKTRSDGMMHVLTLAHNSLMEHVTHTHFGPRQGQLWYRIRVFFDPKETMLWHNMRMLVNIRDIRLRYRLRRLRRQKGRR